METHTKGALTHDARAWASSKDGRCTVAEIIDGIGFGTYQVHCCVVCSGFIFSEASLLSMSAGLMKAMGGSIGITSRNGEASLTAMLFVGFGAGTLLAGFLADPFGRRLPMLIGYLGMASAAAALALAPTTRLILHTFLFMLGVSAGSGVPISLITLAETSPTTWRGFNVAVLGMAFSLGELWSGIGLRLFLPHMGIGPWHIMMLWAALPAMGMLIFGLASPIANHDSPQWLAMAGQRGEVVAALNLTAEMNGHPLRLEGEEQLIIDSVPKKSGSNWRMLCSHPWSLRVACTAFLFFAKDFAMYGMSVFWPVTWRHVSVVKDVTPATEQCATALLGIPGVLVAAAMMTRCPRRDALGCMACLCVVATVLLIRLPANKTLGVCGAVLFKLCFSTWQMVTMLLPTELFPTEMKGLAYSLIAFTGRIAAILAPILAGTSASLFLQLTACLAAMSAISVFTLPETKDTKQDAVPSKSLAADCDALKEGIGEHANYGSGFRSV